MNEEDNLSEEGLGEVIKKQDEKLKKDLDEINYGNKELEKRQKDGKQLDIPGLLDPESGFRTTLAIGTEVGLNTLLDLFSADPTQLTQIFGSQGINALAQRIRGGKFSRGEMIASGIASLLPGGAQARSLAGTVVRTSIKGGVSGAIETGAADLIDTGKIDPERVTAGFGVGTTFGGLFGTATGQKGTKNFFKRLRARMGNNLDPNTAVFTREELASMGIGQPMMSVNDDFGGDGGFFKRVVEKVMRNKRTAPSLFVDPVTLKPKRGFTQFEMASALDRYIDNLSKKSGYKSLADFKVQVLDELKEGDKLKLFKELQEGENLQTGYIEHMIAKASKKNRLERLRQQMPVLSMDEDYLASELSRRSQNSFDMDWYWSDTYIDRNGITRPGLNKGDRDASKNVRINFNNRYKALKDVVENTLYGTEAAPGIGTLSPKLENRLIVSVEDIDRRSFIFNRTQLGDVVIRRAGSNKLIGKLGNYLDVLYPQNNNARSLLLSNVIQQINPDTGARFASLDEFRDYIISKRIGIIVDEAPALKGKSNAQRKRLIDEALQDDLIKLYEDYPFLPKPKYINEITNRGLDQNVGPFPSKTQQRKYIQGQLKGRLDE